MKRLALIVPLFLLLIGCESDFDKCFKINEEKVIKETVSGLDGEKASLPSGSRALRTSYGLIERLVPNEYADYFKAFDDQYRRGCLNQMGTTQYAFNQQEKPKKNMTRYSLQ